MFCVNSVWCVLIGILLNCNCCKVRLVFKCFLSDWFVLKLNSVWSVVICCLIVWFLILFRLFVNISSNVSVWNICKILLVKLLFWVLLNMLNCFSVLLFVSLIVICSNLLNLLSDVMLFLLFIFSNRLFLFVVRLCFRVLLVLVMKFVKVWLLFGCRLVGLFCVNLLFLVMVWKLVVRLIMVVCNCVLLFLMLIVIVSVIVILKFFGVVNFNVFRFCLLFRVVNLVWNVCWEWEKWCWRRLVRRSSGRWGWCGRGGCEGVGWCFGEVFDLGSLLFDFWMFFCYFVG